jgi:CRP/FNR family transcriptional regulator, cyclic AMP receptor protein
MATVARKTAPARFLRAGAARHATAARLDRARRGTYALPKGGTTMQAEFDALRRTDIFAGVPDEHLETLANRAQHRIHDLDAIIFRAGDPGDALYVITEGEVRLSVHTATHRDITLANLGPGDTFGELSLLDSAPRSATAKATAPTRCLVLKRQDFLEIVEAEPAVARAVMRSLALVIRRMNERLAETTLDVHRRVSKALLALAEKYGRREGATIVFDRPISDDMLASEAGLYPMEVARVIRDLQYDDIVRIVGDILIIQRPDELRAHLQGRPLL